MLLPTTHTTSGRQRRTFSSRIATPASISALLSSAPFRLGRATMLVSPREYCAGMLRSSLGATSRGVTPDEHSSRQKRLVGCA
jgi:hypothetical protein